MSKIAIKPSFNGSFKEGIVLLKKHTGLSMTDIKNKIAAKDFFAETNANDIDNMEELKVLVDHLLKLNADVNIFDSDIYGERVFKYQEISYNEFIHTIDRLKEVMEELHDVNNLCLKRIKLSEI
ncbi:hypothetical protein Q3A90_15140 [Priestia megaterium]|uniref:hypothetical protein n=1 Tax=Priestia megaterium TaxID=1404 RepID=UPI002675DC1B|nr:hypothetical protein [Priestia megaterium]WKU21112.1 hypothetical protein Q3A90_15140 [Priestia megaterium]